MGKNENQDLVESAIREQNKLVGVATHQFTSEFREEYQKDLPAAETEKQL